jgi:prevent-host-death family protein
LKKANLHEAKTNLSKLVDMVIKGEKVVICKAGNPVAELVPFKQEMKPRKGGFWKGKVKISKDFDAPLPEFEEYL